MTFQDPTVQKPGKVQAMSIMLLVNGILNVLWGIIYTFMVVLGTIGIGLLCVPYTILPIILGIFEIVAGTRLMGNPPRKYNIKTLAILEIISIITMNFISLTVGILNLVFVSDPETQAYLDSLPS